MARKAAEQEEREKAMVRARCEAEERARREADERARRATEARARREAEVVAAVQRRRAALLAELDSLVVVDESKIGHAHDVCPEALKWCDVKDVILLVGRHDRLRD